jgi:anti-anti-sigma factor
MEPRILTPAVGRPAWSVTAMPASWKEHPARNALAGATTAIVSLPLAMGLGALAFSPFGPDYVTTGVLAGLYSAGFLGLIAVLAGARGVAIYAPRSLVSFMIAAVCADLVVGAPWLAGAEASAVVATVLLLLALSGAFQVAFGALHLARLVKFIPTPVMAGFQNAAAVIIVYSQLHLLLGLDQKPLLAGWGSALADIRPLSLLVAAATLAFIYMGPRIARRVPPIMTGLLGGTLTYYLLVAAGLSSHLGGTVGAIPFTLPDGRQFGDIMALFVRPGFMEALPSLVAAAASIAVVASLDTLISAKLVENLSGQRGNSTRELLCIGAANTLTPLLGGVSGSVGLSATTANFQSGARHSLSLLVHGLLFLVMLPLLAPLLGGVPIVVLAALVAQAGYYLFDRWTLQLLVRAVRGLTINWSSLVADLVVIALVTVIAVAGEVVLAVGMGISIALVVFALRMSRGVIRSWRHGDTMHSRRTRDVRDAGLLASNGRSILMVELEGPMFFGSVEQLHNRIDAAIAEQVRYIVLDITRVNEIDSTGARILRQTWQRMRAIGAELLICGQDAHHPTGDMLRDHGVGDLIGEGRVFPDLDRALEWCENHLLAGLKQAAATSDELPLETLDITQGLSAADCGLLREALTRVVFQAGDTVFAEGDQGDALYIIVHGSASVRLMRQAPAPSKRPPGPLGDSRDARDLRLVTFSAGTVFGEMALLDSQPRSATVTADETLVCHVLERRHFEAFAEAHPRAGMTLLSNLARALSLRIRQTNRTLGSDG